MSKLINIFQPVFTGTVIVLVGTIPRNIIFAANLRLYPDFPWGVPLLVLYMWLFWRYLSGSGAQDSAGKARRESLRAKVIPAQWWLWALTAGTLAIIALVFMLHLANRLVILPQQSLPDLTEIPAVTIVSLLLAAAPVAGIIEEVAFRGYMQQPLEKDFGLPVAILITGTMFAIVHLDFTLILWPYYVLVAAIYGTVTYLTKSILPAIVLHSGGNIYSNLDLWLRGKAEWQAPSQTSNLIWQTGADSSFWQLSAWFLVFTLAGIGAFIKLARVTGMQGTLPADTATL